MKNFLSLLVVSILIASCHSSSAQQNKSPLKRVIVIRHGEKPEKGENLSCQGLNRSLQLADVLNKKFGTVNAVFVPSINTGKKTSTARMYQTIVPYAVKYDLNINTKYDVEDTGDLAQDVLKQEGTVLIVWEHDHIDNILKALGIANSGKWPGDDFDSIWIVSFQNGKPELTKDREGIHPDATCK